MPGRKAAVHVRFLHPLVQVGLNRIGVCGYPDTLPDGEGRPDGNDSMGNGIMVIGLEGLGDHAPIVEKVKLTGVRARRQRQEFPVPHPIGSGFPIAGGEGFPEPAGSLLVNSIGFLEIVEGVGPADDPGPIGALVAPLQPSKFLEVGPDLPALGVNYHVRGFAHLFSQEAEFFLPEFLG